VVEVLDLGTAVEVTVEIGRGLALVARRGAVWPLVERAPTRVVVAPAAVSVWAAVH
jgi:hypothetical protein